jgi:dihydroorotate dehydrogenase (NAD+) catalytic subunit
MIDLSVQIGTLRLKNPVLTASGTFGYGTEYRDLMDVNQLGAVITKTITLEPRDGNPMPRIAETPGGMLNSIGLANVGVERFIWEKLPLLKSLNTNVIVNVAGNTVEEYRKVVERLNEQDRIDGFEVNISCPNVEQGGLAFGTDPAITEKIVRKIKKVTRKTVIVKLTPNVTDIVTVAQAAVDGGADSLSLINTVLGMGIDIQTRKPLLGRGIGGLSGPAIKPIALAKLYQVANAVSVPLIGIGGIMSANDGLEFIIGGATAVQVGTLTFVEPDGVLKVLRGIEDFCQKNQIKKITDLVGSLKKYP